MHLSTEALEAAIRNAHVAMGPEEVASCQQQLAFVLEWAQQLESLPLENTKPTAGVGLPDNCPTRADVATPSLGSGQALSQAPATLGSCFLVPQTIE